MPTPLPPLSVLDLAIVGAGSSPAQALRNSTELIQHVERLGYRRHWVAEHHNMPGIASSSPPVLLAHRLPFSFAHHFSAGSTDAAVAAYRENFRASDGLAEPHLMLGVSVICAETDAHAEWLAGPSRLSMVRLRTGRSGPFPTPEEAAERIFTPMEKEIVRSWASSAIVGSPTTVEAKLHDLVERTGADELIVTTMVHGHEDRLRSYELLADLAGLDQRAA